MNKARTAVTIALLCVTGAAHAVDPPLVKEGFWSTKTQITANPGGSKAETTAKICRSHAFDAFLKDTGKKTAGCTTISESFVGHTWSSEEHCSTGLTTLDIKTAATVDGDSSLHSETHTVMTPPLNGVAETIRIGDSSYLGNCPAGVQPGDFVYDDGRVVHGWKH